jgi:hypothetical protein
VIYLYSIVLCHISALTVFDEAHGLAHKHHAVAYFGSRYESTSVILWTVITGTALDAHSNDP